MKRRILALILCMITVVMLLPTASADYRTFKVNSEVTMTDKGHVIVTWEDSEGLGPYSVYFKYAENSKPQYRYLSEVYVTSKVCEIDRLIPGKQYMIYVSDRNGDEASGLITVPRTGDSHTNRKQTTTLTLQYAKQDGKPRDLGTMSAEAMTRNIRKGYSYGLKYMMKFYSAASKQLVREATFAFYSPTGFVKTEHATDFTLPKGANWWYWYNMLGDTFFDDLYSLNGEIPAGKYKFELYLDGHYFYGKNFTVKP